MGEWHALLNAFSLLKMVNLDELYNMINLSSVRRMSKRIIYVQASFNNTIMIVRSL